MTARGRTDSRKLPYQNTSLAVSRQKQTGLERGVLRDAIQQSAETEQYGLCSQTCHCHLSTPSSFEKHLKPKRHLFPEKLSKPEGPV